VSLKFEPPPSHASSSSRLLPHVAIRKPLTSFASRHADAVSIACCLSVVCRKPEPFRRARTHRITLASPSQVELAAVINLRRCHCCHPLPRHRGEFVPPSCHQSYSDPINTSYYEGCKTMMHVSCTLSTAAGREGSNTCYRVQKSNRL
jgi:hypothetical protein